MRADVRIRDIYVDGTGQDIIGQEKVEECTHPLLKLMMHSNCTVKNSSRPLCESDHA